MEGQKFPIRLVVGALLFQRVVQSARQADLTAATPIISCGLATASPCTNSSLTVGMYRQYSAVGVVEDGPRRHADFH